MLRAADILDRARASVVLQMCRRGNLLHRQFAGRMHGEIAVREFPRTQSQIIAFGDDANSAIAQADVQP